MTTKTIPDPLEIFCRSRFTPLSNIVHFEGKSYYVDTSYTPDCGLETMIFRSKPQPETDNRDDINMKKINWTDIYARHYGTAEEATKNHNEIVHNIDRYI